MNGTTLLRAVADFVPEDGSDGWHDMVVMSYRSDDPLAVTLTLNPDSDEPVEWVMARSLLRGGLTAPVGYGTVRVWPQGDTWVCVRLAAGGVVATLRIAQEDVCALLRTAYQLVPAGQERVDVDTAITNLLARRP